MFEFYKMSYELKYLKIDDLKEATKWGCITPEEYKIITQEEYKGEIAYTGKQ